MKLPVLLVLIAVIVSSCGPSPEEIQAREQFLKDSLQTVHDQQVLMAQKSEELRIHNERIEVGKSLKRDQLLMGKEKLSGQIREVEKQIEDIKVSQLLRSQDERKKQLDRANQELDELKDYLAAIDREISYTSLHQTFDFQSTPTGVVEHIFEAANSEDYSKLRHLIDPYGEANDDVLRFCLVDNKDNRMKTGFNMEFAKGRIIGEPKLNGEFAEIEVATGIGGDRLRTIELVQRMDKWYLYDY